MYAKLALALCAISLSLYGRQAESMSPPPETTVVTSSPVPETPTATSSPDADTVPALKPMKGVYIDWKERMIHAIGTGQASENAEPSARRMLALRAAQADAMRKLASVVYGMHIDPVTTIDDQLAPKDESHQKLRIKIEGLIKGSKEAAEPEAQPDGSYKIHLILPLDSLETTLSLKEPLPKQ